MDDEVKLISNNQEQTAGNQNEEDPIIICLVQRKYCSVPAICPLVVVIGMVGICLVCSIDSNRGPITDTSKNTFSYLSKCPIKNAEYEDCQSVKPLNRLMDGSSQKCRFELRKNCKYWCSIRDYKENNEPYHISINDSYTVELTDSCFYVYLQMEEHDGQTSKTIALDSNIECDGSFSPKFTLSNNKESHICQVDMKVVDERPHVPYYKYCTNMTFDGKCNYMVSVIQKFNNIPYRYYVNDTFEMFVPDWFSMYNYFKIDHVDIARKFTPIRRAYNKTMVAVRFKFYTPIGTSIAWIVDNPQAAITDGYGDKSLRVCYIFKQFSLGNIHWFFSE